jgi:hypothetical protein
MTLRLLQGTCQDFLQNMNAFNYFPCIEQSIDMFRIHRKEWHATKRMVDYQRDIKDTTKL